MIWKFLVGILCVIMTARAEERIFFLHLPKSGGITFRSVLADRYAQSECPKLMFPDVQEDDFKAAARQYLLVHGHLLYFRVQPHVKDFKKVTILRHPVDRVISEHNYILNRIHPKPREQMLREHGLPEKGDPIETAENVACRFFSKLNPLDPTIPIEKHLESAKEVLSTEFDFVGITEKMEESIQLFYHYMGWQVPEWTPVHNTTEREKTYPQEVLDAIAKRNWADIELYQYAVKLFEAQKMRQATLVQEEKITWVSAVDYDFNQALDGWGWCPRENLPEGTFRWLCSPEKGMMAFPLEAGFNYRFKAKVYIELKLISSLRILVNNHVLKVTVNVQEDCKEKDKYVWAEVEGSIPKDWIVEAKKTQIEWIIDDPKRVPSLDAYRGRCGSNRIQILPEDAYRGRCGFTPMRVSSS